MNQQGHGQLRPGNIANQKYEINLQLKHYFTFVRSASPTKEVSSWRKQSQSHLQLRRQFTNEKRRYEAKLIAKGNERLFTRLEEIKKESNVSVMNHIDCHVTKESTLNLLNHLHGYHAKNMLRQRKLKKQNELLKKHCDAAETTYKTKEFEKDFQQKHMRIKPMLSRRPISSGILRFMPKESLSSPNNRPKSSDMFSLVHNSNSNSNNYNDNSNTTTNTAVSTSEFFPSIHHSSPIAQRYRNECKEQKKLLQVNVNEDMRERKSRPTDDSNSNSRFMDDVKNQSTNSPFDFITLQLSNNQKNNLDTHSDKTNTIQNSNELSSNNGGDNQITLLSMRSEQNDPKLFQYQFKANRSDNSDESNHSSKPTIITVTVLDISSLFFRSSDELKSIYSSFDLTPILSECQYKQGLLIIGQSNTTIVQKSTGTQMNQMSEDNLLLYDYIEVPYHVLQKLVYRLLGHTTLYDSLFSNSLSQVDGLHLHSIFEVVSRAMKIRIRNIPFPSISIGISMIK